MAGLKEGVRNTMMAVLALVGAGVSYATGGWKGMATFGAAVLGSMA